MWCGAVRWTTIRRFPRGRRVMIGTRLVVSEGLVLMRSLTARHRCIYLEGGRWGDVCQTIDSRYPRRVDYDGGLVFCERESGAWGVSQLRARRATNHKEDECSCCSGTSTKDSGNINVSPRWADFRGRDMLPWIFRCRPSGRPWFIDHAEGVMSSRRRMASRVVCLVGLAVGMGVGMGVRPSFNGTP